MSNCLYCEEVPKSEEHPLPAALGEFSGAPMLVDRICKLCNERRIGVLDEQFVRCGPVAVLRKRFGIKGREHHDKVNSFYRGSAGGQRIKFLAWDESKRRAEEDPAALRSTMVILLSGLCTVPEGSSIRAK